MVKHCTNCDAFAWWDGDFCCTARMSLIESAPDGKFWAILPDAFDANKCKDYKHDLAEVRFYDYDSQYINFIKETYLKDDEGDIDTDYWGDDFILDKFGYKHYDKKEK